jgi:hypothetical protein
MPHHQRPPHPSPDYWDTYVKPTPVTKPGTDKLFYKCNVPGCTKTLAPNEWLAWQNIQKHLETHGKPELSKPKVKEETWYRSGCGKTMAKDSKWRHMYPTQPKHMNAACPNPPEPKRILAGQFMLEDEETEETAQDNRAAEDGDEEVGGETGHRKMTDVSGEVAVKAEHIKVEQMDVKEELQYI